MTDILASFGVGGDQLPSQNADDVSYPTPVQGRVAHIDADFLAYQVSAETRDELDGIKPRKSFEDMQNNAREAAEHLMRLAGATSYRCHVTPSASNKGGRPEQAVQQEYQCNRRGREKPEFLDSVRAFIGQELNGVVHLDQEADDGMARANYDAMQGKGWGDSNLSVIVSKDKDLRMVPGLHYDFDTDSVFTVGDHFGSIWLDEISSTKELKGWGTKFFWAQCLMGDPADSIKGLPEMPGTLHCRLQPTVAYKSALAKVASDPENASARRVVQSTESRTKKVGPVMAYEYLKDVQNDRDAFQTVKDRWVRLEKEHGHEFTHWRTGQRVTATQALLGDMLLLWMRRNANQNDVVDWLKEVAA